MRYKNECLIIVDQYNNTPYRMHPCTAQHSTLHIIILLWHFDFEWEKKKKTKLIRISISQNDINCINLFSCILRIIFFFFFVSFLLLLFFSFILVCIIIIIDEMMRSLVVIIVVECLHHSSFLTETHLTFNDIHSLNSTHLISTPIQFTTQSPRGFNIWLFLSSFEKEKKNYT